MKHSVILFVVLVGLNLVGAEYQWTGTEWKWVEEDRAGAGGGGVSAAAEGSGGNPDDEDYDYGDDYGDENLLTPVSNNNNNFNNPVFSSNDPVLDTIDDEDMVEGSGDDLPRSGGGSVDPWEPEVEGSGDINSGNDFSSPSGGFGGVDTFGDMQPTGGFNPNPSVSVERSSTTESPVIDLDSPGPDSRYPTSIDDHDDDYKDYDPYDDKYDDEYFPPYDDPPTSNNNNNYNYNNNNNFDDDIGFEDTRSTTTTTTTTTSTPRVPATSRPTHHDTPVISDVPTNRPVSFFAQPGILAAVIGGAVVGLLCAILLVMFIVYRMRKKDEGSYILDEPSRKHNGNLYTKTPNREIYA